MRPLLLVLSLILAACSTTSREELRVGRAALAWRPLLMQEAESVGSEPPPAPGSTGEQADRQAIARWEAKQDANQIAEIRAAIDRWLMPDPVAPWLAEADRLLATDDMPNAAHSARVLALLTVASYDTLLLVWRAKAQHGRPVPAGGGVPGLPSYPDATAAVAAVAGGILAVEFPEAANALGAKARAVADIPVAAQVAYPSDTEAGWKVGNLLLTQAVARLARDRAARPQTAANGWNDPWALSPEAGNWQPWVWSGKIALSPPALPGSSAFAAEVSMARHDSEALTIRQRALAIKWLRTDMARNWMRSSVQLGTSHPRSAPEAARTHAFTAMALCDAAIASGRAQYQYGCPRPTRVIKGLETVVPDPAQPGYPAETAAMAIAASQYLQNAYPDQAAKLAIEATDAAEASRYAGWNFANDIKAGQILGQAVGQQIIAKAQETAPL